MRTDAGKRIEIAPSTPLQFEQGYVVPDLKGISPDRVLVSEEYTERLGPFSDTYQAISRASQDVAIYTPHPARLHEHAQGHSQEETNERSSGTANGKGSSLTETPGQWLKDYKAALSLDDEIEPVPLSGSLLNRPKTLALDSEPTRVKRVLNALTPNEPDSSRDHGLTQQPVASPTSAPAEAYDKKSADLPLPSQTEVGKTEKTDPPNKQPVFDRSLGIGL